MDNRILSVTELNTYIKAIVEEDVILSRVYVRGELSNYKVYPSGHHYFTMKDETGALKCVMFKGSASKLAFRPENGMKVIALGRVSVYERDGAYQLYVSSITPDGIGDLSVAFEQLKAKLNEEGLFDPKHKKPLPKYPTRVAIITSSAGAAVRDMIRVSGKRWPMARLMVLPVRVQGAEAPAEIAGAIKYANRFNVGEVIITGRGGGSIEDLWAFNDERVARAIYASEIPVVSAVGHEPDVTISDFVADVRAATPSNGAEIVFPDVADVRNSLSNASVRIEKAMHTKLEKLSLRLEDLSGRRVMREPGAYIDDRRVQLDLNLERLCAAAGIKLNSARQNYVKLASALDAMSPLKVLGRGYSIARNGKGEIIRSSSSVKSGEHITIRFLSDELGCTVD